MARKIFPRQGLAPHQSRNPPAGHLRPQQSRPGRTDFSRKPAALPERPDLFRCRSAETNSESPALCARAGRYPISRQVRIAAHEFLAVSAPELTLAYISKDYGGATSRGSARVATGECGTRGQWTAPSTQP